MCDTFCFWVSSLHSFLKRWGENVLWQFLFLGPFTTVFPPYNQNLLCFFPPHSLPFAHYVSSVHTTTQLCTSPHLPVTMSTNTCVHCHTTFLIMLIIHIFTSSYLCTWCDYSAHIATCSGWKISSVSVYKCYTLLFLLRTYKSKLKFMIRPKIYIWYKDMTSGAKQCHTYVEISIYLYFSVTS